MHFVEFFSNLIHRYFVVAVALAIIPLKLLMVRLCKDRDSEMDTMLAIPEDLSYVCIGLILSSATAGSGPLHEYFRGSPYVSTDIMIVLLINFAISILIHKVSQSWTRKQYMLWRAASDLRDEIPSQMELALSATEDEQADQNLFHLLSANFVKMLFSLLLQFVIVGVWLYRIAAVCSGR